MANFIVAYQMYYTVWTGSCILKKSGSVLVNASETEVIFLKEICQEWSIFCLLTEETAS